MQNIHNSKTPRRQHAMDRSIEHLIAAMETSDGAGVRIRRSIGKTASDRLDPFLMLDEFGSDRASDYIAGFPPHPHRGFETVTYMLDGRMLHEDHLVHPPNSVSSDNTMPGTPSELSSPLSQ